METWKEMEKLFGTSKVRAIGVSNFSIKTLEVLLPQATVVPAVNHFGLIHYLRGKGIHPRASTPLGQGNSPFFSDETLLKIADKHNITVGQVLLSWGYQKGTPVIPKSENEERLRTNLQLVKLDDEDIEVVSSSHKKSGMHKQLIVSPLIDPVKGEVWGRTHAQLGWNLNKAGS
ncbi:hypothetical protein FRB99_008264 [Tulasnella sp. 403]|nr:hypothetical protein FRB99_008264 [Tulasnella sp. 403]